jgi:hypothetical protein
MKKKEALETYKTYIGVLEQYEDADEYFVVNDDKDLHRIKISLPEPPEWNKIDGFGEKPEDQYFKKEKHPLKLRTLEDSIRKEVRNDPVDGTSVSRIENTVINKMWDFLENNPTEYAEEIKWIKKQVYRKEHGYWLFINGKPTFLDGVNYFYLNFWSIEGESTIEYRDRDRKWFLAQTFAFNDTTVPVTETIDGKESLVYDDDGFLKLKDVGYRVCFGTNNLKPRRVGDTSKSECRGYCMVSSMPEVLMGIQGDTDDTGKNVFRHHLAFQFRRLPFFFKPLTQNHTHTRELHFRSDDLDKSLESRIDYADTRYKEYYDGKKLYYYHGDEVGKTKGISIHERHDVVKNCCSEGRVKSGYITYTTTVDNMDALAGKEFFKLSEGAHYEKRYKSGSTPSGLYNIFFPAYEGYRGFIGKFGESIVEDPTEEQVKWLESHGGVVKDDDGKPIGAKRFLQNERDSIIESGDLEKLSLHRRLFPMTYKDCFAPPSKNIYFNIEIISNRMSELQGDKNAVDDGYFVWEKGQDSRVIWVHDTQNAKFKVSKKLTNQESNQRMLFNGVYFPENTTSFISSADPFRVEKTEGGKMSDGGGAVYWNRDYKIDFEDKDIKDFESESFVCTYRYRPDTLDEYYEDMLMMMVYYNAMMYPENNVSEFIKFIIDRGYGGYLLYDIDIQTGKPKNNPGFSSQRGSKTRLFNLVRDWVNFHAHRCRHYDLLEEIFNIRGLEDMTNYDLFTAAAGCLMGKQSSYSDRLMGSRDTIDIAGALDVF